MASRQTIEDFYVHTDVATVRLDDLNDFGKAKPTKGATHYFAHLLAFLDRNIGLRHLFLLSVLVVYSFIGGYVFYYFESNGEAEAVPARKAEMDRKILEIVNRYKNDNSNLTLAEKAAALKEDYKAILMSDGVFKWSTYYKTDEPDHWKWTLGSSFFYSMNVYTTVGYGSIAPETFEARCFTMLYGTLFCPLTWIIIRDLGQLALVYLTTIYARLKLRFMDGNEKGDQHYMLPYSICVAICAVIMAVGSVWVYYYDALSGPPDTGLDWFLSMYFTFQTFTTIGLGDVMPNNIPFSPILCTVFFFSLPMLKVINRLSYLSMENGVHGTFAVLSKKLHDFCYAPKQISPEVGASPTNDENANDEPDIANQLTIHSIATFMQSNADVFGGQLGRVNLRKSDIVDE